MIGKVQQDSFPCLRIRIASGDYEPSQLSSGFGSPVSSPGESLLPRDCQESLRFPSFSPDERTLSPARPNPTNQQQNISRYKTELCRPYQEHGVCKYGEKCQFAHGVEELRNVNRHPKYKTDMCRTYHSVGFCPYGPRCHFIHALDELRPNPTTPEKKSGNGAGANGNQVKQLPMFGGNSNSPLGGNSTWTFNPDHNSLNSSNNNNKDMTRAVAQLNNFFNMAANSNSNSRNSSSNAGSVFGGSGSSEASSRSGSFCSDLDSPTSSSPPPTGASSPLDVSKSLRLPIFSRLA